MNINQLNESRIPKHNCFIALGSNLDNPLEQLDRAIFSIYKKPDIRIIAISSVYWSKPLGPSHQADFANQVIQIITSLEPNQLLIQLQEIEKKQGKITLSHWGPRKIDLDLLLYDDFQVTSPTLSIPHPQMYYRDFVLFPLYEICSNLILPNQVKLAEIIQQCPISHVYALQPSLTKQKIKLTKKGYS